MFWMTWRVGWRGIGVPHLSNINGCVGMGRVRLNGLHKKSKPWVLIPDLFKKNSMNWHTCKVVITPEQMCTFLSKFQNQKSQCAKRGEEDKAEAFMG